MTDQEFKMRLYLQAHLNVGTYVFRSIPPSDVQAKTAEEAEAIFAEYQRRNAPEPDTSDCLPVKIETLKWLLGEAGDFKRPEGSGIFWWRIALRKAIIGDLK